MDHQEYELAARLRDQIEAANPGSLIRVQQPGQMGVGTDQQRLKPPAGWKPPPKPDLMTRNTKPRCGRK